MVISPKSNGIDSVVVVVVVEAVVVVIGGGGDVGGVVGAVLVSPEISPDSIELPLSTA